jgi:hypothetical protein
MYIEIDGAEGARVWESIHCCIEQGIDVKVAIRLSIRPAAVVELR